MNEQKDTSHLGWRNQPMTLERIEQDLAGIKERAYYGVIDQGRLPAQLEYSKRGEFMVRDMDWLIQQLHEARGQQEDSKRCGNDEALKGAHAAIYVCNQYELSDAHLLEFGEWLEEQTARAVNYGDRELHGRGVRTTYAAFFAPSVESRAPEGSER